MSMRIRIKEWLIALALTVLAGCAALLYVSQPLGQAGFTGSRVKNPDAYLLDIEAMNGTDLHTLELSAGDVLRVTFDKAAVDAFAAPEYMPKSQIRIYNLIGKPISRIFMGRIAKQLGCKDKLDARPYEQG